MANKTKNKTKQNLYALILSTTFPTHTSRQVMFFTAGNFGCLVLKFTLQNPVRAGSTPGPRQNSEKE